MIPDSNPPSRPACIRPEPLLSVPNKEKDQHRRSGSLRGSFHRSLLYDPLPVSAVSFLAFTPLTLSPTSLCPSAVTSLFLSPLSFLTVPLTTSGDLSSSPLHKTSPGLLAFPASPLTLFSLTTPCFHFLSALWSPLPLLVLPDFTSSCHLFDRNFLSTYYILGRVLSARETKTGSLHTAKM